MLNNTVPFVGRGYFVRRVENSVPKSFVVFWRKELPRLPSTHRCDVVSDNLRIDIPRVSRPGDLYGTHLEVRLMDETQCLRRFIAWTFGDMVHVAAPNDKSRDIDNLDVDLWQTKRSYAFPRSGLTLRLRRADDLYFASFEDRVFPVDCSCF